MQVVVTVAHGYGCLTSISSYFKLFELCKTAADEGKAILQQSDGGAKRNVVVRCYPFLEETSEREDFERTASANASDANGLIRKCLAVLGVEKLLGEGTFPLTTSVAQMGHCSRKIWFCTFSSGESLVQVSDVFLHCNDTLWNAFEQRKLRFFAKIVINRVFFGVSLVGAWVLRKSNVALQKTRQK